MPEWTSDEWPTFIASGEVPEPPADLGGAARNLWESYWAGPLRARTLPQLVPELRNACRLCDRLEVPDLDVTGHVKLSAEYQMASKTLILDPVSARAVSDRR